MIRIGKSRLTRAEGRSYLWADVTVSGEKALEERSRVLWFSLDSAQEQFLAVGRADAFVWAVLESALRLGQDITCEDPMSERLHYQLHSSLIPALTSVGSGFHPVCIQSPFTAEKIPCVGATGTGFSGGADCLYTIMTHERDREFPLTHLAVFNAVSFQKYGKDARSVFADTCRAAAVFAGERGYKCVFLDTNSYEVLAGEDTDRFYTYRIIACVLALQGLFSAYLLSSGRAYSEFYPDLRYSSSYDPLLIHGAQTETVSLFLAGAEAVRWEKIAALSDWEPSYRWLHACYDRNPPGERNCGLCRKCKEAMTILYALGKLDRYRAVFAVDDFLEKLPRYLAYVLVHQDYKRMRDVLQLFKERKVEIPSQAYELADKFRRGIEVSSRLPKKE